MSYNRILRNAIMTPDGTVIESMHRHDFVHHTDANGKTYSVDGGSEYLKRSFDINDYVEMSVYDDGDHIKRRENMRWGVNYDKDMNKLPETEWRRIMDLNEDHINAIIDNGYVSGNKFYEDVFKDELEYRNK